MKVMEEAELTVPVGVVPGPAGVAVVEVGRAGYPPLSPSGTSPLPVRTEAGDLLLIVKQSPSGSPVCASLSSLVPFRCSPFLVVLDPPIAGML